MIFQPHPLPGGCEVKQPPTTSDGSQGSNVSDHIDPEIPIEMEMELGCSRLQLSTNNQGFIKLSLLGWPRWWPLYGSNTNYKILMFEGECGETLYI